jgi:hypothetical protein
MAHSYAIVYAIRSGMHRRTIVDEDGDISIGSMPDGITYAVICSHPNAPPSYHPLAKGESAIIEPSEGQVGPLGWKRAIRDKIGKEPTEITCALINEQGVVEGIICADPDIDMSPSDNHLMVECYSPQIVIGCTYDEKTGLFTTMEGLIPVGAPGNDTQEPIIVPPTVIPK